MLLFVRQQWGGSVLHTKHPDAIVSVFEYQVFFVFFCWVIYVFEVFCLRDWNKHRGNKILAASVYHVLEHDHGCFCVSCFLERDCGCFCVSRKSLLAVKENRFFFTDKKERPNRIGYISTIMFWNAIVAAFVHHVFVVFFFAVHAKHRGMEHDCGCFCVSCSFLCSFLAGFLCMSTSLFVALKCV